MPDNVKFEIDDVEAKDWTWPDNHFDYLHSRFMLGSISSWKRLIRKAFQCVFVGSSPNNVSANSNGLAGIPNRVVISSSKN